VCVCVCVCERARARERERERERKERMYIECVSLPSWVYQSRCHGVCLSLYARAYARTLHADSNVKKNYKPLDLVAAMHLQEHQGGKHTYLVAVVIVTSSAHDIPLCDETQRQGGKVIQGFQKKGLTLGQTGLCTHTHTHTHTHTQAHRTWGEAIKERTDIGLTVKDCYAQAAHICSAI
jgi:hypothetical protein